jgi:hypothetical protein
MKTLRELLDFSETLILKRFTDKDIIEEKISEFLGFKIELETLEYDTPDYCMGVNLDLGDRDLYFDMYYLIDKLEDLYITEINYDSDYALYDDDLDKKIIGGIKC